MLTLELASQLLKEFFQIGLFSFGGGYSTLPFIYNLTNHYSWFTTQDLSQMIAIATITPGPVAVNVATYVGMKAGGVLSAFVVTTSEILPEFIIAVIVAKLLKKFSENFYVKSAIWALKPTSCALLSYVAIKLFVQNIVFNEHILYGSILFLILLAISIIKQQDPLKYILFSASVGIILVKIGII